MFPLIEDFYTLQGEGFHTGKAAYFLRLGGCDIGCYWCDSKISWQADLHKLISVEKIVERAISYPAKSIVVTGGEPLTYDLNELCKKLNLNGIRTFIETSGSYELSGNWDWICLSPKKNAPPKEPILQKAHELKVIIYEDSDFEWAEKYAKLVNKDCILYLQPEWSRHKKITPQVLQSLIFRLLFELIVG